MKKILIISLIILLLPVFAYSAITCSGTRIDVLGQKYNGTVSSVGSISGNMIYIEVAGTPFEENIVETGTADSDCQFHDGVTNRPTLEDNSGGTASFTNTWSFSSIAVNTNDNLSCASQGVFNNYNLRMSSSCFKDVGCNDPYEIQGHNPNPTDWTVVFDGNMLVMTSGDDAGSEYNIHLNSDNRIYMSGYGFKQATPVAGDTFRIPYSRADMIYYGCGSGCTYSSTAGTCYFTGGKIFFQDQSRRIMAVDIMYNGRIGNNSTWTYFGDTGYSHSVTNKYPDQTGWGNAFRIYGKTIVYGGEWNPLTKAYGQSSINFNYTTSGYSANAYSAYGSGDKDAYYYGIRRGMGVGQNQWPSTGTAIEVAYTDSYKGKTLSYHNDPLSAVPNTANSSGDFIKWSGGNWGECCGSFGGNISNMSVVGIEGESAVDSPAEGRGLGWLGGNSGDMGDYFGYFANANLGLVGVYQDSSSRDIDFWLIDQYNVYDYSIFIGKSYNPPVVDSQTKQPISAVTFTLKDRLGNIVSYEDSGADITESVDISETLIDISDDTPFTAGMTVKVDHEYWYITVVTDGTPDRFTVTRESRLPLYFPASIHENNTATFDPNIYIIKALTTDANGALPEEQFIDWATMVHRRNSSANRHQVTYNGVNYTTLGQHVADQTNKPPSAYWTASGTQGIEWLEGKRYAYPPDGTQQKRSYDIMCPCPATFQKSGYKVTVESFEPNMDSVGLYAPANMVRRRFIEKRSREGL